MNMQLSEQLSPDILYTDDNTDMQKIFMMLKELPQGCVLLESMDELYDRRLPAFDALHNRVTTIFVAIKLLDKQREKTVYLADYVLPGFEDDQAERIAGWRVFVWKPENDIIYKGRVDI